MKKYAIALAALFAVGAAREAVAVNVAEVAGRIGKAIDSIDDLVGGVESSVVDVKNMADRMKGIIEMLKQGMPIEQAVRVVGGNLSDLQAGLVSDVQEVIDISLRRFAGIFSSRAVEMAGQFNKSVNSIRGDLVYMSDVLASTRLPQGSEASLQAIRARLINVEPINDLQQEPTGKKPGKFARLKFVPKLVRAYTTLEKTVPMAIKNIDNLASSSKNLVQSLKDHNLTDADKVNQIGRQLKLINSILLSNVRTIVGVVVTDLAGALNNKVALGGRKFSILMENFGDMFDMIGDMLLSVRQPNL